MGIGGGDIASGMTGFLQGLSDAVNRLSQQRQQRDATALEVLLRSGAYEPSLAQHPQAADFLSRLFGQAYQPDPTSGAPVLASGLTAKKLPPVEEKDFDRWTQLFEPEEAAQIRASVSPFLGQPRSAKVLGEVGDAVRGALHDIRTARRQHERDEATRKREEQKEFDRAKRELIKAVKDSGGGEELAKAAREASSMDELHDISSRLPSPLEVKIREREALRPVEIETEVQKKKALAPYERTPQGRAPSVVELALKAANGDQVSLRALQLYRFRGKGSGAAADAEESDDSTRLNMTQLSYLASGPDDDPRVQQARRAWALLEKYKALGVEGGRKRKKGERTLPEPADPHRDPNPTYSGDKPFVGQGPSPQAPRILEFKRLQ